VSMTYTLSPFPEGQKLIESGDRNCKFFVVQSGEIDILDESGDTPQTMAVLRRGEFTGEVAHVTSGPSLDSAVARGDCEVYEVPAEGLRQLRRPGCCLPRRARPQRVPRDSWRQAVEIINNKTGEVPRTEWLPPEIERDAKAFVRTGAALAQSPHWTARRPPFLLETSRPGVFAAGDVRSGSVKRVASAVGEGAMAVQCVHEYFKTM
jgi:hypothetical protein